MLSHCYHMDTKLTTADSDNDDNKGNNDDNTLEMQQSTSGVITVQSRKAERLLGEGNSIMLCIAKVASTVAQRLQRQTNQRISPCKNAIINWPPYWQNQCQMQQSFIGKCNKKQQEISEMSAINEYQWQQ